MVNFMKPVWPKFLLVFAVFVLASFFYAGWHSFQAYQQLNQLQLDRAQDHAQTALPVVATFNKATFLLSPDLKTWQTSLELVSNSKQLVKQASGYLTNLLLVEDEGGEQTSLADLAQQLQAFNQQLEALSQQLNSSWLARHFISTEQLADQQLLVADLTLIVEHLAQGQHQYLAIFQNSQELRATGGFMGSYARLNFDQGQLQDLQIADIYEPDGQFKGFVEAPPGVSEYLSSGNGLRLPDANWHPDLPTSAKQILSYFAFGKQQQVEGLVMINLSLAEKIMELTGEVFLPDYGITVTADNLADVARADREHFFAGSQQKPNFLNALMKHWKIKLGELNTEQQQELISILLVGLNNKDLQFYSNQPDLQTVFEKHDWAGQLLANEQTPGQVLYLVESNVGINKANQGIDREVIIDLGDYRNTIKVEFENQNPPSSAQTPDEDKLHYINYQRVIVGPESIIHSLTYRGQPIKSWNEKLVTNSHGDTFKQIGFLLTLPEQESGLLTIELTQDYPFDSQSGFLIVKQPGLPRTYYTVRYGDDEQNFELENDTLVSF